MIFVLHVVGATKIMPNSIGSFPRKAAAHQGHAA
jgi:hypothetical protein